MFWSVQIPMRSGCGMSDSFREGTFLSLCSSRARHVVKERAQRGVEGSGLLLGGQVTRLKGDELRVWDLRLERFGGAMRHDMVMYAAHDQRRQAQGWQNVARVGLG